MNIFVGNLPFSTTEDQLRDEFGSFGDVSSVKIIVDRETGRSRGFGFVEMPSDQEASAAIQELDQKDFDGRQIRVSEARPRQDRR